MYKRFGGVALTAAILAAVSVGITLTLSSDSNRPEGQLVSAAPASAPVSVSALQNTDNNRPAPNTPAQKQDPKAATCDNPVVTFTEPVSLDFKNNALVVADQALKKFEQENGVVATQEQRDAFFLKVAELLPTEMTTEVVFDNNEESFGDREAVITDQEVELNDTDYGKLKSKVKQLGCRDRDDSSAQFVSYSTVTYTNTVGWKSCTKTVSFSALNGLKVAQLRLVSEWYNNAYQVPQWVSARATSTAYWVWSTDGDPTTNTRPWQFYSWGVAYSYQNRAWANFKYEISGGVGPISGTVVIDRGSLYAAHVVGPGGKCV